jgi:hypothetical protein
MTSIPDDQSRLLTREQLATALSEAGFPTKAKTLSTKASRGGGPMYVLYGPRALDRWSDALVWAKSRLSAPRGSTSETSRLRTLQASNSGPESMQPLRG